MIVEHRLGVMGGAFNPIHLGHLTAAEEAREAFCLDEVLFVPCGEPPWPKEESLADAETRFTMVAQAIADNPAFRLSRLELERPGPSYTAETLRVLRVQRPGWTFFLIIGLDAAIEFDSWREPAHILEIAELVVVTRPPYQPPSDLALLRHPRVHLLETSGVAVSAREIRERIRAGRSIRYLVSPMVTETIAFMNLYREEVLTSNPK